jgi:hypothetical protein
MDFQSDGERFSLSPGERAEVRAGVTTKIILDSHERPK